MGAGLQIWDNTGFLVFDTNSILANVLGSFVIGGNNTPNGSFQDNQLNLGGQPFYLIQSIQVNGPAFLYIPTISFNGSTVQWNFSNSINGTYPTTTIIYGMY